MDVKIHLPKATLDMSFDVTVEMRGAVTRRNLERLVMELKLWFGRSGGTTASPASDEPSEFLFHRNQRFSSDAHIHTPDKVLTSLGKRLE